MEVVWLFCDLLFGSFQVHINQYLCHTHESISRASSWRYSTAFLTAKSDQRSNPTSITFLHTLLTENTQSTSSPAGIDSQGSSSFDQFNKIIQFFLDQLWAGHQYAQLCHVAPSTQTEYSTATANVA